MNKKSRETGPAGFSAFIFFGGPGYHTAVESRSELFPAHAGHTGDTQQSADCIDAHTGIEGLGAALGVIGLGVGSSSGGVVVVVAGGTV